MSLRTATSRILRSASASFNTTRAFSSSLDRTQTKENYNAVLQKFAEIRACAVLRTATSAACPKAMQAAIDGGFKIVEFTLTTPDCLDHLADFRKKYDGDVMVGCGTIMNVADAERAMDAGGMCYLYAFFDYCPNSFENLYESYSPLPLAPFQHKHVYLAEFIITPVMLPDVIEWCAARNIVIAPGCQTPTEMVNAYRHGAPLQKLFPGVAGGPSWVKAVSSALPFLSINPTSGVDLDNAGEYLKMGAASVGLVAPLFDPVAIANENWDQIAKNAEKVMANVRPVGPYVRK